MGEGVIDIPQVLMVFIIAFFVLGVSAIAYGFYVDVRDVESQILVRDIFNCVAGDGSFDFSLVSQEEESLLLENCEISGLERVSAKISVFQLDKPEEVRSFSYGNFAYLNSIKKLFEEGDVTERISKYEPGYFGDYVLVDVEDAEFYLSVEVYVENEF